MSSESFTSHPRMQSPYDSRILQKHEETKRAFEQYQRGQPEGADVRTSTFGDHGMLPLRSEAAVGHVPAPYRTHYPAAPGLSGESDITSEASESEGEGESSYGDISSATETQESPQPVHPRPEIEMAPRGQFANLPMQQHPSDTEGEEESSPGSSPGG